MKFNNHELVWKRNVFDKPTTETKRFEMHTTTLNPGNQSHVLQIPIEGLTEEYIDDTWIKSAEVDIIFKESQEPHALKNIGKSPCTYFAFQFE